MKATERRKEPKMAVRNYPSARVVYVRSSNSDTIFEYHASRSRTEMEEQMRFHNFINNLKKKTHSDFFFYMLIEYEDFYVPTTEAEGDYETARNFLTSLDGRMK
jgi:hypothetical protein